MATLGVIVGAATAALTALLGVWVRRRAAAWGLVAQPRPDRLHQTPTPTAGGIAIALGFTLVLGGAVGGVWLLGRTGQIAAWSDAGGFVGEFARLLAPHLDGIGRKLPQLAGLLAGGLVLFGLGLIDDRRRLGPGVKLAVETAVAAGLVLLGVRATLFLDGRFPGAEWVSGAITVLWMVGITNAFNLLDHMDGVCAGTAAIAGVFLMVLAYQTGQLFIGGVAGALTGAAAGFLVHNAPPAKLFMGDSGSLFFGYHLAALTVLFTFYREPYPLFSVAAPLVLLAVPLYDTVSVVIIRLRQGRPVFQGDTSHFAHRLLGRGMSVPAALLVVLLLTFCCGLASILLYRTDGFVALVLFSQVLLILLLVALLESGGRRS